MIRSPKFYIDWPLFLGLIMLCSVGLFIIYSASNGDIDTVYKQLIRLGIAIIGMLIIAQLTPLQIKSLSIPSYLGGIALLFVTLVIGDGRGTQRWIELSFFKFQPSELMKLAVPMTVAWVLSEHPLPANVSKLATVFILIILPVVLIAKQPDLGTAILVAVAGLSVIFIAGIKWSHIGYLFFFLALSLPIAWQFMYDYQKSRILIFLDPGRDPLGNGYQTIQSIIAVGSGGLAGKGWLNGTQSHLEFLPERSTDFIFAVLCEEFGFVGSMTLLLIYCFIIGRAIWMSYLMKNPYQRLLSMAIICVFCIYIIVNIGMVIGQLPVVGIPLPLISFGGTSMATLMAGFGILISFYKHRHPLF